MNQRANFYSRETTAADYLQMRAPRELWAAVLEQAIRDAVEGPSQFECRHLLPDLRATKEFRLDIMVAAQEWIADEEDEPRRFVWVCGQLGLNPDAVRRRLVEKQTDFNQREIK